MCRWASEVFDNILPLLFLLYLYYYFFNIAPMNIEQPSPKEAQPPKKNMPETARDRKSKRNFRNSALMGLAMLYSTVGEVQNAHAQEATDVVGNPTITQEHKPYSLINVYNVLRDYQTDTYRIPDLKSPEELGESAARVYYEAAKEATMWEHIVINGLMKIVENFSEFNEITKKNTEEHVRELLAPIQERMNNLKILIQPLADELGESSKFFDFPKNALELMSTE